ncbi:MAG: polyphenol oxidase family protein [Verrucomicrobiota bacterium]
MAHLFTLRVPGLDVAVRKEEVLPRLQSSFTLAAEGLGTPWEQVLLAEQVHGSHVQVVDSPRPTVPQCDGLLTRNTALTLGILVADCAAVFLVDPITRATGLLHSGRQGTEQEIASKAIRQMATSFGTDPSHLVVQISPCIRPPHYEMDFAKRIQEQCLREGVSPLRVHGPPACTGSRMDRYYSYRLEKGKTGRMLALLRGSA